ncbi:MAG: histidine phosphatase family protein [Anaerolineaceae bacterium]|jgi:broad specificity phosphatase PhoE
MSLEKQFNQAVPEDQIRLFLVRHGQTNANAQHLLQGQSDGALTEFGLQQIALLAEHLSQVHVDKIVSSPYQRAHNTAKAVAVPHSLAVQVEPLLKEWNCGDWDGQPAAEFRAMIKEKELKTSQLAPPNGETFEEVKTRGRQALQKHVLGQYGKVIMFVAHGDINRSMISELLNISIDSAGLVLFDSASYSVLEKRDNDWFLVTSNRIVIDEN